MLCPPVPLLWSRATDARMFKTLSLIQINSNACCRVYLNWMNDWVNENCKDFQSCAYQTKTGGDIIMQWRSPGFEVWKLNVISDSGASHLTILPHIPLSAHSTTWPYCSTFPSIHWAFYFTHGVCVCLRNSSDLGFEPRFVSVCVFSSGSG